MNKNYFVYIVTNFKNTVLYTGITDNIIKRVYEHKSGLIKNSFSERYHLYKLVWFEVFPTPEVAIAIEKRIKGWKRYKKINLIKEKNSSFKDLSEALR